MSLYDLEMKWRERATEAAADGYHATSKAMRQCATELRAALAGGGEAVGEAHSMPGADGFTMASFHAVDVPPGTKLFTHPEGAVQVTDEMVDRACDTFLKDNLVQRIVDRERMRAAITAALQPSVDAMNAEYTPRRSGGFDAACNPLTYKNQPDNVGAWRLGEACRNAKPGGDPIDHGLSLLKELQEKGYGVVALNPGGSRE